MSECWDMGNSETGFKLDYLPDFVIHGWSVGTLVERTAFAISIEYRTRCLFEWVALSYGWRVKKSSQRGEHMCSMVCTMDWDECTRRRQGYFRMGEVSVHADQLRKFSPSAGFRVFQLNCDVGLISAELWCWIGAWEQQIPCRSSIACLWRVAIDYPLG